MERPIPFTKKIITAGVAALALGSTSCTSSTRESPPPISCENRQTGNAPGQSYGFLIEPEAMDTYLDPKATVWEAYKLKLNTWIEAQTPPPGTKFVLDADVSVKKNPNEHAQSQAQQLEKNASKQLGIAPDAKNTEDTVVDSHMPTKYADISVYLVYSGKCDL